MLILHGTVFTDGKFEKKDIRITEGRFTELVEPGSLDMSRAGEEQILDAEGYRILPGLVDVHTHGRAGEDFSRLTAEGLQKLLASYAACGVTSVLGTTMTNEPALVEPSLRIMAEQKEHSAGAGLLGVHMEGPFLGAEKKGAHAAQLLKQPDLDWLEQMQELSGGGIRLVTIDPALEGADVFIKTCREKGIRVSLGHTACDYETAVQAQQAGADHVTHLFNAMSPLHHREPGLIGAALDTGMYTELICDGIHVHPSVVRLMFAAHPEKVLLVSDSIPAAGMPEGEYVSGGCKVISRAGTVTLEDGTIAGSAISLFDAMVAAIAFGVGAEQAVNSVTRIPAESIGMEQKVGSIVAGRAADFLLVDESWKLAQCFIHGERMRIK